MQRREIKQRTVSETSPNSASANPEKCTTISRLIKVLQMRHLRLEAFYHRFRLILANITPPYPLNSYNNPTVHHHKKTAVNCNQAIIDKLDSMVIKLRKLESIETQITALSQTLTLRP